MLPKRSREHAIPVHGVDPLALGAPPPKHQNQHIPGDKRSQARDGGKKAHQRALAHITIHPTAHLPKNFSTECLFFLEGQAQHIITTALYTLAAHEHNWDPTAIPTMPPPPQGPKDPVTPFHIDQLLRPRATPHLRPSRIEIVIAYRDTPDTPFRKSRRPHPQSGRPMVGPPLDTQSPHGGRGLYPKIRRRRPPRRPPATPPSHHPHRPRGRSVGGPPHGTLPG